MRLGAPRVFAAALAGLLLATVPLIAHHEILAKFDDKKPMTLNGVVTLVDWRNPHVHVFMNVKDAKNEVLNWAVELESPIDDFAHFDHALTPAEIQDIYLSGI